MTAGWVVATVVGSAVGSSLLTLALAAALIRWRGRRWLERSSDVAGARIAGRLRATLDEAADEVTGRAATRIRSELGDELAGRADELMPRLREEIHHGFRDALSDVLGARTLGRAGEELARRGASVVEAGLGLLLGRDDDSRS